ncbi:MAG: O-methyltransferase [Clostridia bacterium]|nr:O-methyltransferase [Clostridia bacterium]MDD3231783.1 O-methyltransferase [Clostridia bacterium]MDD3862307.1 O-methyltransferase [Clostridia bacterium]MDD4408409.1 O-methyltransferase [Clostridia bacterium]
MEKETVLSSIEKFAVENKVPILLPESRTVLKEIIKSRKPQNILEIGTAIGYSGCLMLLNSHESKLTTIEKDSNMIEVAKSNFQHVDLMDRVFLLHGDATEIIKNLPKKYDFIFLDGPKSQYVHQLPFLLDILNEKGLILADNVCFRGLVFSKSDLPKKNKYKTIVKNLRKFIDDVKNNPSLKYEILEIGDGLMIIQKAE